MRSIRVVFWMCMIFAAAALTLAAAQDWKAEFEDICSKTDVSATLTAAEAKSLVERCDKLKPRIEQLDESTRKIYLRRLETCRNLFRFMADSKAAK